MTNKLTHLTFLVYSCYLPPEGSPYSDTNVFFSHLISSIYLNNHIDNIFFCGDFNSRIGSCQDIIQNLDQEIPLLNNVDKCKNGYCDIFIDFLKDVKLCIINGRVSPEHNDYTYCNVKGLSVVDYIVTNHESLPLISKCQVHSIHSIIEKYQLYDLLSNSCKAPDHSIVEIKFSPKNTKNFITVDKETVKLTSNRAQKAPPVNIHTNKFYLFDKKPELFMANETWRLAVIEIINNLQSINNTQHALDIAYDNLCKCIFKEMDMYLEFRNCSRQCKKRFKNNKPFWNEELTVLWKAMKDKEKCYRKCQKYKLKQILKK